MHIINGHEFNYECTGTGDDQIPLTLVHGVGADMTSWDGVIESLTAPRPIVRYDQRGHGQTEKIPGPYVLDDFVEDLRQLLDHLDIAQTHLVGFSLGGLVAQAFALKYPKRLDRLILISTICGRSDKEKQTVLARAKTLLESGASAHLSNSVDRWFTDAFQQSHPHVVAKRLEKSKTNHPQCYAASYKVLAESDLIDQVHRISVPTLVMTGECDLGSTPRMSQILTTEIPNSTLIILKNLKHSVLYEAPQTIAAEINRFLCE